MEKVDDYNALEALEKTEGREVLVVYSGLIHHVVKGEWKVVGRKAEGGDSDESGQSRDE